MIRPVLQGDRFLADVKDAAGEPGVPHLWWLGQSGFLLQWQGEHLLLDPYLSDSLTHKYANTEKPHIRMTELVIEPHRLDFIDVVTSSHNHTDHLDGETLRPLLKVNQDLTVIVPEANRDFAAERLQVDPSRLAGIVCDCPMAVGSFTFHAVPAAHETLETDAHGNHKFIGLVVQFDSWTLYHSGDTLYYNGMAERLQNWSIDIAILPINGRDPARGVAGNLSGPEAIALARQIGAGLVVACHYDMFEFNTVSPEDFRDAAMAASQIFRIPDCGERFSPRK